MKAKSASKTGKVSKRPGRVLDLSLYVSNRGFKSVKVIVNFKKICHERFKDRCHVAVIDIEKSPNLAKENQIVAIPTLIKTYPLPMRRVIGDLSDTERVLAGLNLRPAI